MADTTIATYLSVARTYVLWCLDEDIVPPHAGERDIARFLAERRRLARPTFATTNIALRAFFEFCVRRGWTRSSPMHAFPVPVVHAEPQRAVTIEQVQQLIDACETHRDYALVLVLSLGGVRARELLRMQVEHIDWSTGQAIIYAKGRRHRTVNLPPLALGALREYIGEGRADGPVWRSLRRPYRPLTHPGAAWQILQKIARAAGIEASPHMLRRSLASLVLRSGGDVGALQQLLGHATPAMSLRYAEWESRGRAVDAQRRVADRLTG